MNTKTQEKRLHLEHIEDEIINFGVVGGTKSIQFLEEILGMLEGHSNKNFEIQFKVDGSPNIVFGINPENKQFFIGTKSVFSNNPKINYTESDIAINHGSDSGLTYKLKVALRFLKTLGGSGVYSGDLMFTTLKQQVLDGKNYLTFKPNVIMYAVDPESEFAKVIKRAKMGIFIHTQYRGKDLKSMIAEYNVNVSQFKKTPDVWYSDPYYRNLAGKATFTKNESVDLKTIIQSAKSRLSGISKFEDVFTDKTKALFKTFVNSQVRIGVLFPPNFTKEFLGYVSDSFDKEIATLKTIVYKERKAKERDALLANISNNTNELEKIVNFMRDVTHAKDFILRKLQNFKDFSTFIQTDDGFKLTKPEGFVITDFLTNGAVKLVDRLVFSRTNLTVEKDWVKGQ